ncbi:hypothetical protein [Alterinioella nitratireducens]|uniref:hypothetical protein n=1 Tax=Alterinioella nitratireducens TaxID=2735915 RepID=UPI004058CD72
MTVNTQGSLFGEGKMTPPTRSSAPDPETIRGRLNSLLETLRSADVMPLSERDIRMWRAVVPNMTKWLPEHEAIKMRQTFAQEMERLRVNA